VNLSIEPGTSKTFLRDDHSEVGEMPSSSASASTNGLKAEPGWRWPCVARLKGAEL
jgi:hypothetical protein